MNGEAEAVRQLLDRWILHRRRKLLAEVLWVDTPTAEFGSGFRGTAFHGWGLLPSGDVSRLTSFSLASPGTRPGWRAGVKREYTEAELGYLGATPCHFRR